VGGSGNDVDLGELYAATWNRVTALVSGLDVEALATPVPACPGWAVRDVVAHLAAVAEDACAGRLTGPPDEQETAAQVARLCGQDIGQIQALWEQHAAAFAQITAAFGVWPAVVDVASHEQDIRGALDRPGARDNEVIWHCAGWLLNKLQPPVTVHVQVEDAEFLAGPDARHEGTDTPAGVGSWPARTSTQLALITTRFEAFRWRMGRRSRAQLAALPWSGDPSSVLDHLAVFGPAPYDIVE
jgi:uncharacterized protein (TIGR03083 family)